MHLYTFQSPVPIQKELKYTRFLQMASSLTPIGRSVPRAPEHLDTFLITNSQSAVELPKKKKTNLKLTELFCFFKSLFQQKYFKVAEEQTSLTMQKRYINPTGRRQSLKWDTKSGNKKIQSLSLIFAISTGFLFRFVPNTVQQSKF